MNTHKYIRTLKDLQDIQLNFCKLNGLKESPQKLVSLLSDELFELYTAIQRKNTEEIRGEIADVIIFAVTLANYYQLSLTKDITAKMRRNFQKYDPELIEDLKKTGLSTEFIMQKIKSHWNKRLDKAFLRRGKQNRL